MDLAIKPWILRNQSTSDYGVDVEIEIAGTLVSGILIKGQVKSKTSVEWRRDETFREPVPVSKLNYWRQMRLPVILFLVDNTSREVFWQPVNNYIESAVQEEREAVIIQKSRNLETTRSELEAFTRGFIDHSSAQSAIQGIPFLLHQYARCQESYNRDHHLPVELDEYTNLEYVYNSTLFIRGALGLSNSEIIPWRYWPARSATIFGSDDLLRYGVHDEAIDYLREIIEEIKTHVKALLDRQETSVDNFIAKTELDEMGADHLPWIDTEITKEEWKLIEGRLSGCRRFNLSD